ncbi:Hypothetical predicted protein [Podarcis lilfordi]|uniref:Uncharacterized protein n=1 Tax=Podarcis lilfordi TaxID=74358 RepID=A0AA35JYJ3_9SAUR|nr:Hypothetical predicted protein [Podarcis lilfordi]
MVEVHEMVTSQGDVWGVLDEEEPSEVWPERGEAQENERKLGVQDGANKQERRETVKPRDEHSVSQEDENQLNRVEKNMNVLCAERDSVVAQPLLHIKAYTQVKNLMNAWSVERDSETVANLICIR